MWFSPDDFGFIQLFNMVGAGWQDRLEAELYSSVRRKLYYGQDKDTDLVPFTEEIREDVTRSLKGTARLVNLKLRRIDA